ncbi:hypothetical protein GCM10011609_84880 [Lentzea pudingi]|uniref:Aldehyde oxidase/xanthine dehydrogenase second molybdopterin binding domain-containing protein n=2 Tax=Lentzea pudingi TaxID=1789439 RepID=A0ABQ2ITE4_9PSEU|nr:hypothetical protein GCM10011609_84880 [Lentzea pudingi]
MREPDGELLGWGCATASYPVFEGSVCDCRMTVAADGRAHLEVAAHKIGTGTYTTLAQIGADAIGLRVTDVRVSLGDSDLPRGLAVAGSSTTASIGSAVHMTGLVARERLVAAAADHFGMPTDAVAGIAVEDGIVRAPDGRQAPVGRSSNGCQAACSSSRSATCHRTCPRSWRRRPSTNTP